MSKKKSSHRELPRIPAPESWTREEALRRYVYVLLPQYFSQSPAEGVLFYASVDGVEIEVNLETLQQFLVDHADRTFITYDALPFHHVCLDALKDFKEHQVAVWRLSWEYRLWDVTLLERRIRYAVQGFSSKTKSFDELRQAYATGAAAPWDVLRSIFTHLIDYAVAELPLFVTFWEMGATDENDDPCSKVDLPRPLTADEYCELVYEKRYADQYDSTSLPQPTKIDYDHTLSTASAFRRRDIVLHSQAGPMGIGLDAQASIVASYLNNHPYDARWNELKSPRLDYLYREISRRLANSKLACGFQWEESSRCIARDSKGFLLLDQHKLQARLSEIWKTNPSFITSPFTAPRNAKGGVSIAYADWLDYRHLDDSIADWIRLETIATVLRLSRQQRLPGGMDFPELRTPLAEGLTLLPDDLFVLQPAPNHVLLSVRIENLSLIVFLFTMLSEHLLYKPIPSDARTPVNKPYFDAVVGRMLEELRHISKKPKEVPGPEFTSLGKALRVLPDTKKLQVIEEVVESYLRHEDAAALRQHLRKNDLDLSPIQVNLLNWITLRHLLLPILPNWYEIPYFKMPDSSESKRRNHQRPSCQHDAFMCSPDPNDLLVRIVENHFGTKSAYPSSDSGFMAKVRNFGWSIVNDLIEENYSTFLPKNNPGGEYDDLLAAMRRTSKEQLLEEVVLSNAVSPTGRVGRPIQYYEMLFDDCRQLADDIRTSLAFRIIESGYDLISVSDSTFTVQVSSECAEVVKSKIEPFLQQHIRNFLQILLSRDFTLGHADGLLLFHINSNDMVE